MIDWTKEKYAEYSNKYPTHAKILRFLISGGMATFTNLALLYVLTDIFRIWYIASAIMAFIVAFVVSFTMQKFWTFGDMSRDGMHRQAVVYFTAGVLNLCLNTVSLYAFVEYFGFHYLISQIVISALIAVENYFIYQFIIFKRSRTERLP